MGTSTGRLEDVVAGSPRDQMMGRSGDVPGTSVKHVFKFNPEAYLTYFDMILVNCSSEKCDLRVCGKVSFLIFWHKQEKVVIFIQTSLAEHIFIEGA